MGGLLDPSDARVVFHYRMRKPEEPGSSSAPQSPGGTEPTHPEGHLRDSLLLIKGGLSCHQQMFGERSAGVCTSLGG